MVYCSTYNVPYDGKTDEEVELELVKLAIKDYVKGGMFEYGK